IFDSRLSYNKGAYLLHMLRWKMGDSSFFRGVRRYINDPAVQYGFARTADLKRNLELESGQDFTSFFNEWFYGQGIPTNKVSWQQDNNNLVFLKIDQTTSHPSVAFFEMPVPVRLKNSIRDTTVVLKQLRNGQTFLVDPGFAVDSAFYDPKFWILSNHTPTVHNTCGPVDKTDSLYPFYSISWQQNANKWVKLDVMQTHAAASSLAENIPMYLHFAGEGKDTAITIRNIRYSSTSWLNLGFTVQNSYITAGSCLLSANYAISSTAVTGAVNEIKIYPSPVYNSPLYISIKNPSFKKLHLQLFTDEGKCVYDNSVDTPGRDELISIPVTTLAKAGYILSLSDNNGWRMNKKILRL
ncbi:MAG: hypothetical protein JST39_21320, partial [Bacteroidetes bacterium]|nr:hypothetical protein [Bacteroidota bacterium]